jgi:hypothetical protein
MKKSYNRIVAFFKNTGNSVKNKVSALNLGELFRAVRGPLIAVSVIVVYLSMGHLFPKPLKAETVIGAPHSFVGKTWTSVKLVPYSVHKNNLVITAKSPFSKEIYVQIPLVGWLKV